MLPDFPSIKQKLQEMLNVRFERTQEIYMNPLSQVPQSRVFEGNRIIFVRENGSSEEVPIEKIEVNMDIDLREVGEMPPDVIFSKTDAAAKDMAIQKSKVIQEEIEKSLKKVGNIIDVRNEPFCVDHIFKALEKIWIEFDENEKPILPTIVAGEKAFKSISEALPESEKDPECRKRFEKIMERKKEEWRVRESNRKLVG